MTLVAENGVGDDLQDFVVTVTGEAPATSLRPVTGGCGCAADRGATGAWLVLAAWALLAARRWHSRV